MSGAWAYTISQYFSFGWIHRRAKCSFVAARRLGNGIRYAVPESSPLSRRRVRLDFNTFILLHRVRHRAGRGPTIAVRTFGTVEEKKKKRILPQTTVGTRKTRKILLGNRAARFVGVQDTYDSRVVGFGFFSFLHGHGSKIYPIIMLFWDYLGRSNSERRTALG